MSHKKHKKCKKQKAVAPVATSRQTDHSDESAEFVWVEKTVKMTGSEEQDGGEVERTRGVTPYTGYGIHYGSRLG